MLSCFYQLELMLLVGGKGKVGNCLVCFFKVEYVEFLRFVIINCCCLLVEKEKLATVLSVFLRAPVVSAAAPKTLRYCHQQLTS